MEKVKKAIEAQPPFALLCRCRLTFVALALIVDFYSQPLILHIFFNENLCATHYSYRSVHPAHPTRNIRNVQFIIADAIRKWVLAGTNKCKQLRSHLVALPIPTSQGQSVERVRTSSLGFLSRTIVCGALPGNKQLKCQGHPPHRPGGYLHDQWGPP